MKNEIMKQQLEATFKKVRLLNICIFLISRSERNVFMIGLSKGKIARRLEQQENNKLRSQSQKIK